MRPPCKLTPTQALERLLNRLEKRMEVRQARRLSDDHRRNGSRNGLLGQGEALFGSRL